MESSAGIGIKPPEVVAHGVQDLADIVPHKGRAKHLLVGEKQIVHLQ